MTRDEVVAIIAERLGQRTDLNAAIIAEMQLAQSIRLEQNGKFMPWFLLTEYSTVQTEADEPRVAVPDDFIQEEEESGLWVQTDAGIWIELRKASEDKAFNAYEGVEPAQPERYALAGDHLTLFPTPDKVYNLRMRYFAQDIPLTSDIQNKWLKYAADLVIAEVGQVLAGRHVQDQTLEAGFQMDKAAAWQRLWLMHEARMHANREYSMGDN
jgi:hypothetical protein